MGGSGCGKSSLLRVMIGLQRPARGDVLYDGEALWQGQEEVDEAVLRGFGVLFQSRRPVELDDAGRKRGAAAERSTPT